MTFKQYFVHIISAVLTIFIYTNASAGEHKMFKCAKYLVGLKQIHSVPSISEQYTNVALSDLHFFRAHRLSDFSHHPSSAEIIANSRSSKREKQMVTSRLSALIREGRSTTEIDSLTGEALRKTLVGSSIVGAENIIEHLDGRENLSANWASENKWEIAREGVLRYIGSPLINAALTMISVYPSVLTPLFVIPNRGEPETMIRSFSINAHGSKDEKVLKSELKRLSENSWSYRSFDLPVPEKIVQKIARSGELDGFDLMQYWDDHVSPRITYKYTTDKILNIKHTPQKRSWVRVDELLYFDKSTQEPTLLVFVRTTEKVPPYPKASKAKSSKTLEVLDGVHTPIGK